MTDLTKKSTNQIFKYGTMEDAKVEMNLPGVDVRVAILQALERENGLEFIKLIFNRNLQLYHLSYALDRAASMSRYEIVKFILEDGRVDPDYSNNQAIRWAAENGDIKMVLLLLSDKRVTPKISLASAAQSGNIELVQLFLEDPRVVDRAHAYTHGQYYQSLDIAVFYGHYDVVKLLLTVANPGKSFIDSPLITAAKKARTEIVILLLGDGRVNINKGFTQNALSIACEEGYKDIVKLLLSHPDIDPNAAQNAAIKAAIKTGQTLIIDLLLQHPGTYLPRNLKSDIDEINQLLVSYLKNVDELNESCVGQIDPISLDEIPPGLAISWKEGNNVFCFNKDVLSEYLGQIGKFENPLNRQPLPKKIVDELSMDVIVGIPQMINHKRYLRKMIIGKLIVGLWREFELIPDKISKFNFYVNTTDLNQHILHKEVHDSPSLFDMDQNLTIESISVNSILKIEIVQSNHVNLQNIIKFVRSNGIEWI